MVAQAVDALLALDWPAFEVIVIDNNTADARARQALAAWMAQRGDPRLRFAQWERLAGFKAGALNQALTMTDPEAGWVAVVDPDYVVDPGWFRQVQAHMEDLADEQKVHPVLFLDEAQLMPSWMLEQLHILLNFRMDSRAFLSVVLVGLPELRERLGRNVLSSLSSRLAARVHLDPLRAEDVGRLLVGLVVPDPFRLVPGRRLDRARQGRRALDDRGAGARFGRISRPG